MIGEALNHLWQSTALAVVAWLLTVLVRGAPARVRYWIWFSASVKFLVPFALLIELGSRVPWPQAAIWAGQTGVAQTLAQIGQPFPDLSSPARAFAPPGIANWLVLTVGAAWACGLVWIGSMRLRMWRRIRAAVRASSPLHLGVVVPPNVRLRRGPGLLEPGVVGWLRPILLVPAGIETRLTPEQLAAVLAHEVCHVRRRDNLTAGIQMIVEAVFWFHPLVWWVGARLLDERERACDEAVVQSGSSPRVYAEAILRTCQFYLESPLACVAGVTGSHLANRIEAIMRNRPPEHVSAWKKLAVGVTMALAVAVPVSVGVLNAAQSAASSPVDPSGPRSRVGGSGARVDVPNFCCPAYLVQVIDRIRGSWVEQPEVSANNVVTFTIERDGRIADVAVSKPSGHHDLDEISRRALLTTKRVSPLPAEFPDRTLTVHLRFQYGR